MSDVKKSAGQVDAPLLGQLIDGTMEDFNGWVDSQNLGVISGAEKVLSLLYNSMTQQRQALVDKLLALPKGKNLEDALTLFRAFHDKMLKVEVLIFRLREVTQERINAVNEDT